MQVELIINDFDAGPWLKEGGLTQTEIVRAGREVVTLDGTKHQAQITKRGMTAAFVEMRDRTWFALRAALKTRPVTVRYLDEDYGNRTALFLVSALSASTKTARGGITYYGGGTVTLEEM